MNKKPKWIREYNSGTTSYYYRLRATLNGHTFDLCSIAASGDGRYCLPDTLFPLDKNYNRPRIKDLKEAKVMCEKWFIEFCGWYLKNASSPKSPTHD